MTGFGPVSWRAQRCWPQIAHGKSAVDLSSLSGTIASRTATQGCSAMAIQIRCPNCGYVGPGARWAEGCGPQVLEVVLFLMLIVPWLVYKAFTYNTVKCPKCGNTKVARE